MIAEDKKMDGRGMEGPTSAREGKSKGAVLKRRKREGHLKGAIYSEKQEGG
jgi:hypothetical protein